MANLSSTDEVVDSVRRFILRREFNEGRSLILGLDSSVACLPAVGLVCASFYNLLGHPNLAEESLQLANYETLVVQDGALVDEVAAGMALVAAQVKIRRFFEFEKSFALARQIEDIYVNLKIPESIHASHSAKCDLIERQSYLWTSNSPGDFNDREAPISDMRVLIEISLFELMAVAVEGGFMLDEEVIGKLQARIPPLITFLRARRRYYAEAMCFFLTDVHRMILSPLQAADFILSYLESVQGEDESVYRAAALSRLVQYQLQSNPGSARLYFDESLTLFARLGCSNHLADCDFVRLRDFERNSLSSVARLGQLCHLAKRYKALGNLESQITAVRLILDIASNDLSNLWIKAQPAVQDMEGDLESVGDMFRLLVTRVVKFRMLAWHLQETESSRRFLTDSLDENSEHLTPDLYGAACEGLYRCYFTLGDFQHSAKYAELEVSSEVAKLQKDRLSDAEFHLADARRSQLIQSIELLDNDGEETEKREELIMALRNVAIRLEYWADWDLQNGRKEGRRAKASQLILDYHSLNHNFCPNQGYDEKLKFWVEENQPKGGSQATVVSVGERVVQLVSLQKFKEAYEYAEQATRDILADPSQTPQVKASARLLVILAIHAMYPIIKSESADEAKEWRKRQFQWLLEDTRLLYLDRSSEMLLTRVSILCWVARDYLKFFPNHRTKCLDFMAQYFFLTDKMCYDLRHSLKSDTGISQLLRKRMINSKFSVRSFYEHAAEFFLQVGNETRAWYWMQRKRGQALIDLLAERASAYDQVQSLLENNEEIGPLLKKEDELISNVASADTGNISSALEDLSQHRDEMKNIPALTSLMNDSTYPKPDEWNNLNDIWSLSEYLPKGTNVLLVDWFVTPENTIYWISRSLKEKDLTPRYMKLSIGHLFIERWIAKYLQFPFGRKSRLESEPKAIWKLRYLLAGLEQICNPGDLVFLTPPARFAAIPLHAIYMDGMAWIERNPIIYSSSFSLYRECLKRTWVKSSSLSNSVFTAVYEEPGYEDERDLIMDQVTDSAGLFSGRKILGTDLTKEALETALTTASWVHYHGHAYYERSEALRQCFVLSKGTNDEKRLAEAENASESNVVAESAKISLEENNSAGIHAAGSKVTGEAMLSSYLLESSSQLTVSDIFALNLARNHPFVCNIACHSGMQEVGAGDEPLGLVTALFCAGASSVLGTLWPIQSSMGRLFSSHFYQSIEKQRKLQESKGGIGVKVLNLALAVREATLEVKRRKNDPYAWAAFVLHGAGFYLYDG